ncbi:MAG: Sulfur carrier protein adenylyltransferase ThiF [Bacteroidetes bacterium]|nr:Sulfur carrier protein adenylyltransferase ThiF [Bacteroidota bacterium]
MMFTEHELERYSRHFVLPEIGIDGQQKLKQARVLIVGAGGLGSPVGLYLAAAGVGTIGIVDDDTISVSNLQRQILYSSNDVGKQKALVARDRLLSLNPTINAVSHPVRLNSSNALSLLGEYDIVADCSDNFPTRYLINDACVLSKKRNVYGSVFRFEGQVTVFDPFGGPCHRCLFPMPPPSELVQDCSQAGVLGVLTGIVGALQANEIIKLILMKGKPLTGRVLMVNALTASFQELQVRRDPSCPVCGTDPSLTSLIDYEQFCAAGDSSHDIGSAESEITVRELKLRFDKHDPIALLDVREPFERAICTLGGLHVPLGELERRKSELDPSRDLVVYCHHGIRSRVAAAMLKRSGFCDVKNLAGGIDAWAHEIDTAMPQY